MSIVLGCFILKFERVSIWVIGFWRQKHNHGWRLRVADLLD